MEPEPEKDSEASQTPSTISDWLDEVGLGPKADESRAKAGGRKFNYAEKFAEAHYDELGYLLSADRQEMEQLLRMQMPLPHKRKIVAHWQASVDEREHYRQAAENYGIATVEIQKAAASQDPHALKSLVHARQQAARSSPLGKFLAKHGLTDYADLLVYHLGCKSLEHLAATSELDLAAYADEVGMGPVDKQRFLTAVNGEQCAAILRRFFDPTRLDPTIAKPGGMSPDQCRAWIRKALSASEQELHDMVEHVQDLHESKQHALKEALDELRPCPAAVVVQTLQEQPPSLKQLQQRAMVYVEKGHAEGGAVLQADRGGLMALIADAERTKHRRERAHERRQVAEAAQAKIATEEEQQLLKRQARAVAERLEEQMGKQHEKMEATLLKHNGHEVKEDRLSEFGVFEITFKPPELLEPGKTMACSVNAEDDPKPLGLQTAETLLYKLGVTSLQLEHVPSEAGSQVLDMAKAGVGKLAQLAKGAVKTAVAGGLASTGIGAVGAPAASQAVDAGIDAALSAAGLDSVPPPENYLLKVTVREKCHLIISVVAETVNGVSATTKHVVKCEDTKGRKTADKPVEVSQDPNDPCQVLLTVVKRDREFDRTMWARPGMDEEPVTVAGWLDRISIGDEYDRQRQLKYKSQLADQDATSASTRAPGPLEYARKLEDEGYDDLKAIFDADKHELEAALKKIKMHEPHTRKFMKHWETTTGAIQEARTMAEEGGVPLKEIQKAEASGDPHAVQRLAREKARDTDPGTRFLEKISSIKHQPGLGMGKSVIWEFEFKYQVYRRPDRSDLDLKLTARYSEMKAFHDQLMIDIETKRLEQLQQLKQAGHVPPGGAASEEHQKGDEGKYRVIQSLRRKAAFPPEEKSSVLTGKNNPAFLRRRQTCFQTYFQSLIDWESTHESAWLQVLPCSRTFFSPREAGGGGGGDGDDGDLSQLADGVFNAANKMSTVLQGGGLQAGFQQMNQIAASMKLPQAVTGGN